MNLLQPSRYLGSTLLLLPLLPGLVWFSPLVYGQSIPKTPVLPDVKEVTTTDPGLEKAAQMNEQAVELARKGEFAQALALHQQVLQIRIEKLGPTHPFVAQSLNNIGFVYHMQGNYPEAKTYYQQGLQLWKQAYGPDALALATSYNNLAYLAQQEGNYPQATELYQQALAIHEKNDDIQSPDYALALNNLATLYQEQGNFPEALAFYQRSQVITEKLDGPDSPSAALGLNNIAYLYQSQGDYAAALPLYEKSLAIYEKNYGQEHLDIALVLANLSLLYMDQGNYPTALPLAERSLAIRQKFLGLENPQTATSLNNIAYIYQAQGNYAQALPIYQQSLAITEKVLGPDHPHMGTRLNNLAHLYQSQGNYEAALPLYQRALAIREKTYGPIHALVGQSYNNLSLLYQQLNDYDAAVEFGLQGLDVREKALGPDHPEVAQSLNNLGFLAEILERYDLALPYYHRSIAIREKALGPNHPSLGITLNNLAYLYYVQKDYGAALPVYQRSLNIIEAAMGSEHPDVALSLNNIASLFWANNNVLGGIPYLMRAVEIEEQTLTRNLTIGSESYKRNYLRTFSGSTSRVLSYHLRGLPNSDEAAELALTTILRRKGRILDVLSNASLNLRRSLSPADVALLDELGEIRSQIAALTFAPDSPDSTPAKLRTLRSQAEQLEGQLSRRSAIFQEQTQPVTIAAVQKQIPADAALIEFVEYNTFDPLTGYLQEPRYAAYILLPKGGVQWVDLGPAAKVDGQLLAFRQAIANPQDFIPLKQTKAVAQQTEALIFAPIRAKLGTSKHLLIAPDGELNLIPFAALVDEQERYLLETYQITYLTSGRDLLRQPETSTANPPLIFADPQYDQPGKTQPGAVLVAERGSNQTATDLAQLSFAPLAATAPEAEAIHGLLPSAQMFTGIAATENQLKQNPRPLLLHLATHGFFLRNTTEAPSNGQRGSVTAIPDSDDSSSNPLLRSGLALAGFNLRKSGSEDGVLTALEVSGLDLRGTKLVVLSACQTGLGDVATGEGVYGLRRAFTLAGAETQLTSLWYVNDLATKELMINYYQRLQRGEGRSDALRQAQLDFLKKEDALHRPYYWAAFVPIGAWQPMSFQK